MTTNRDASTMTPTKTPHEVVLDDDDDEDDFGSIAVDDDESTLAEDEGFGSLRSPLTLVVLIGACLLSLLLCVVVRHFLRSRDAGGKLHK